MLVIIILIVIPININTIGIMMAKMQNGNSSNMDLADPLTIAIILICGFLSIALIWVGFHKEITIIYTYFHYIIFYPIYILSSFFKDVPILSYPYKYFQNYCNPDGIFGLCRKNFNEFTWVDLKNMSLPWNIFFGIILSYLMVKDFVRSTNHHPQSNFSKVHSLDSFLDEQQKQYSHLKLFNNVDLINEPINHPLYGMSLTSSQFVAIYALVKEDDPLDWEKLPDGSFSPIIDQERLQEVLVKQLGNLFQGWTKLSNTELIIFSILLPLVAATDTEMTTKDFDEAKIVSLSMREKIWLIFDSIPEITEEQKDLGLSEDELASLWLMDINIDRKECYEIIRKYRDSPIVREIVFKHAYVKTIIYALMNRARGIGVLSPSEFRWLKFCDRPLWYVVQSVDRHRPFAEAAAVFDHYHYEYMLQEAYRYPYIKNAIVGINEELNLFKYPKKKLLKGNYAIWLEWSEKSLNKLYPGIDMQKTIHNIKK